MIAAGGFRISKSTSDGKQQMARFALDTDFLAMGRAGEVARTSFADEQTVWDYTHHCLFTDWGMQKVGATKPMGFVADSNALELDFYHSGCCFFFYRGAKADDDFLFPTLCALKEPASKMTSYVKELNGKVEGFTDKCSAQSLRIGACNQALTSEGNI